jgi:hypothetical protein
MKNFFSSLNELSQQEKIICLFKKDAKSVLCLFFRFKVTTLRENETGEYIESGIDFEKCV